MKGWVELSKGEAGPTTQRYGPPPPPLNSTPPLLRCPADCCVPAGIAKRNSPLTVPAAASTYRLTETHLRLCFCQFRGLALQLQLQAVDLLVQGLDLRLQRLPVLLINLVHLCLQLVPLPLHLYDLQTRNTNPGGVSLALGE